MTKEKNTSNKTLTVTFNFDTANQEALESILGMIRDISVQIPNQKINVDLVNHRIGNERLGSIRIGDKLNK